MKISTYSKTQRSRITDPKMELFLPSINCQQLPQVKSMGLWLNRQWIQVMIILLIVLLHCLFTACQNTSTTVSNKEDGCQVNEDCLTGICQQGVCSLVYFQCMSHTDCPNGRCVSGACFDNECRDGERQACQSICGMGESLCMGGVWRSCNAPMPGVNGCPQGQNINQDMSLDTQDLSFSDMQEQEVKDMELGQDMALPLSCEWVQQSEPFALNLGMTELGHSTLLFQAPYYLSYFHEINFINFTTVQEDSYFSTITSTNQLNLSTRINGGLLYDAKRFGTSVITATAEDIQVSFKKFNRNLEPTISLTVMLSGIEELQLVALGEDYGVIWISQHNQLNIDRLSADFRRYDQVAQLALPFFSDELSVINGDQGITVVYRQSHQGIKELKALGLDLQGNIHIQPKDLSLGQAPALQAILNHYYVFFINENQKLSFIKLDQNLAKVGNRVVLAEQGEHTAPQASVMNGYLYYTWQTTGNQSNIWLGEVNLEGEQRITPIQITSNDSNGRSRIATDEQQGLAISWHHRISDFASQLFAQKWKVLCQIAQ